jgi:molybdenum cofactor cytidylyltransferase
MKPQPPDRSAVALGAIILAAGLSTRMGQPKLLLPWGKTSVLGHLLEQWHSLRARQVAVVVAATDPGLERELDRLGFSAKNRVVNEAPELGMLSSIQCAARWTGWAAQITHWAIVLGDQPHLRPATLHALLALSASRPESVCQPARGDHHRHPVLLPRTIFLKLSRSSAANLKDFLAGHEIITFDSDDPGLDLDIDRPADYQKALALSASEPKG